MTDVTENRPDFYQNLADSAGITRSQAKDIINRLMYDSAAKVGLVQKTHFQMVAEFHEKFGLAYEGWPRQLEPDMALFRIGFMVEELAEYSRASGYYSLADHLEGIQNMCRDHEYKQEQEQISLEDFEKQMDALIDLDYVVSGTAYLHGFAHDEGYRRVHDANMKKVRVEAKTLDGSVRKSKYDVVKPQGWTAASLKDLLE